MKTNEVGENVAQVIICRSVYGEIDRWLGEEIDREVSWKIRRCIWDDVFLPVNEQIKMQIIMEIQNALL